jgi:dienelactone hydrolase
VPPPHRARPGGSADGNRTSRCANTIDSLGARVAGMVGAVAAVVLLASGCGGSDETAPSPPPPPASPFAYDASAPLAVRDRGRVNEAYPIAVRDVSYASAGGRVEAYLAVPPARGRRPGAVVLHGSGGDRGQLLLNGLWLAGRGAVTIAITAPSATAAADASRGLSPRQALRRQRDLAVRDAVAVRRALDLLAVRPDVDPARLGFLGWSAGARTGAVLAGVEPRLDGLVLMSGGAAPVSQYVAQAPAELRPEVRRLLGEVDPLRYVRRARPERLLLQNGRRDEVVPRAALDALAGAAPTGAEVRWYDAGHELDLAAYRQQLDWLADRLGAGPVVRGARTGP